MKLVTDIFANIARLSWRGAQQRCLLWAAPVLAVAAACLWPASAVAQSRASANGEEQTRALRFYYISYASSEDAQAPQRAQFQLLNGDKVESFSLSANAFSPLIKYRGAVPIGLFKEVTGIEGVERVPLANLDFPSRWQGVLFLVIEDPSQAGIGFRFIPIEYAAAAVPEGSVRFVSFVNSPLAVQLGAERGGVAPGGQLQLQLPRERGPITFRVAEQEAGSNWKMHLSSVIPPFANSQALVIFYPTSANGNGVSVLTVSQLPR